MPIESEVLKVGVKSFKLESIYLDLKKNVLIVNDKECSTEGMTDFSLTLEPDGLWKLSAKKDITVDFHKDCSSPIQAKASPNIILEVDGDIPVEAITKELKKVINEWGQGVGINVDFGF